MGRGGVVAVVVAALALGGCAGAGGPVAIPPGGDRSAHGIQVGAGARVAVALDHADAAGRVVAATWRAGFAALGASDDPAGGVVSPASLVVALAMLGEGATGDSVAAFDAALGASGDARTDAVNALTGALARYEGDPAAVQARKPPKKPVVHVANQVVADSGITVAEPYLDRLVAGYGAGVLVTDLSSDAGTRELDTWVDRNTGGLVKRSAITPSRDLCLVLENAIVLAAAWQQPFDVAATTDDPFTLADGTPVDVPTMHRTGAFGYVERGGWRALRLPYTDDLHADVVLPPAGSPEAAHPSTADPATVAALTAALDDATAVPAVVGLPRLDLMTSAVDLRSAVSAIGLDRLLDEGTADLGGILVDPPGRPFLGQAWQQAVLKVDEQGTRAAAVTEFGVEATSAIAMPALQFLVDRPFLLVVGAGEADWPLFLASVLDPRS